MNQGDWWGPVTDHDINVRFRDAVLNFSKSVSRHAVQVYVADEFPPMTVGVLNGKPCMSRDLHEDAIKTIGKITPENN